MTRSALGLAPRRGLRREDAARYIGLSASKFDELVRDGRLPRPARIDGCVIWDVRKLDLACDELFGDAAPSEDGWGDFDGPRETRG